MPSLWHEAGNSLAHQTGEIQQAVAATIRDEMDGLRATSRSPHRRTQRGRFMPPSRWSTSAKSTCPEQLPRSANRLPASSRPRARRPPAIADWSWRRWSSNRRGGEPDHGGRRSDRQLAANGKHDTASMEVVNEEGQRHLRGLPFQDVHGERIRRAIQHLQQVEHMSTDMAPGEDVSPPEHRLSSTHHTMAPEPRPRRNPTLIQISGRTQWILRSTNILITRKAQDLGDYVTISEFEPPPSCRVPR